MSEGAFYWRETFGSEVLDILMVKTNSNDHPIRITVSLSRPRDLWGRVKFTLKQIWCAVKGYRTEYNFYLDQGARGKMQSILNES